MSLNAAPSVGFHVATIQHANAMVVKCSGRLTSQVTSVLKDEVKPLLGTPGLVVLDFTGVSHLDSSGLGAVVGLYVSGKRAGCELRLINFNQRVKELLGLTHLLSALEACGEYLIKMP
jgi:anti-anti-sigma factor